ncbi:MAG: AMP-binding protein, partial [Pseudomonadota bacterium]
MSEAAVLQPKIYNPRASQTGLFSGLMRARSEFGGGTIAVVDGDERKLTYNEIVRAAFGLGSALKKGTQREENVGILLPTGAGAIIAFYAVLATGRVPAMLNFTAGPKNIKSALKAAEIKRIVTAHKFIELGGLETLIKELKDEAEIVYLEDVREKLSLRDKIAGALGPYLPSFFHRSPHHQKPGVILFTSGTEGEPKGVVLSHENILANVEQVRAHIGLSDETDAVFNP